MAVFTAMGTGLLLEVTHSVMPLSAQLGLGLMLPCVPFNFPSHPPCLSLLAISASQQTKRQVQLCRLCTAQEHWPKK